MKTIEDIKKLVGLDNHHTNYGDIFRRVESIISERDALATDLRTLREKFYGLEAKHNDLLATQPQLTEIRYVLHGDIQPCSVLYGDDTTTLLRLDEGDMMLETDTIEWSDSVTYRCQELLHSTGDGLPSVMRKYSERMAQLVRDERILLNDNGEDVVKPCVAAVVVPAPPPFPRGVADHNNPYVHTTTMFSEEAMRSHGWTNEALVSCGHGHYAPMQYPADMER